MAIIESGTRPGDSVMILVQGTVHGKQICMPVWISGIGLQNKIVIDSNRVTSVQREKTQLPNCWRKPYKKKTLGNPACTTSIKRRLVACMIVPGCNSPGLSYRTASCKV